jgi:hypothetical protein
MRSRLFCASILLALGAEACTTSPTSPAGAITVTIAAPLSPSNGALIANLSQPVTLTVNNALVTDAGVSVLYTFEVATDAGFANKVATKDVSQTSGQTSLKLDPLTAGKDYYWHVRTTGGNTVGAFTNPVKFTIGPAIVIAAPAAVSPANGATTSAWPTLTVANAVRSGPVGSVVYRFDVSTNASFSTTLVTGTVSEGSNQTSFSISNQTPPSQATQYFWRAIATDQSSGISSPASVTQNFTFDAPKTPQAKLAAQEGLVLWPGVQPPGTNGHAALGDNWDVEIKISHGGIHFLSPPIEALRVFDLLDRGFGPQAAIDWMHSNGYPVAGAFFPIANGVFGFDFMYMSFNPITGAWDLVLRSE